MGYIIFVGALSNFHLILNNDACYFTNLKLRVLKEVPAEFEWLLQLLSKQPSLPCLWLSWEPVLVRQTLQLVS